MVDNPTSLPAEAPPAHSGHAIWSKVRRFRSRLMGQLTAPNLVWAALIVAAAIAVVLVAKRFLTATPVSAPSDQAVYELSRSGPENFLRLNRRTGEIALFDKDGREAGRPPDTFALTRRDVRLEITWRAGKLWCVVKVDHGGDKSDWSDFRRAVEGSPGGPDRFAISLRDRIGAEIVRCPTAADGPYKDEAVGSVACSLFDYAEAAMSGQFRVFENGTDLGESPRFSDQVWSWDDEKTQMRVRFLWTNGTLFARASFPVRSEGLQAKLNKGGEFEVGTLFLVDAQKREVGRCVLAYNSALPGNETDSSRVATGLLPLSGESYLKAPASNMRFAKNW